LEWVTRKENLSHGTRNTRVAKTLGKPVGQYTRDGKLIKVWQSTREAERLLGIARGDISLVANGKRNRETAHGYIWKYIDIAK
jgi:hypothetical protein